MEEEKNSKSKKIKNAWNPKNDENKEKLSAKIEFLKRKLMNSETHEIGMSKSDDRLNIEQAMSSNKSKKNLSNTKEGKKMRKDIKSIIDQNDEDINNDTNEKEDEKNRKIRNSNRVHNTNQDNKPIKKSTEKNMSNSNKKPPNNSNSSNKTTQKNEKSKTSNNRQNKILSKEEEEEEDEITEEEEEEEEEEEVQEEDEAEEEEKPDQVKKSDRSDFISDEDTSEEDKEEDDELDFDSKPPVISKILAHKTDKNGEKTYLAKFDHKSYHKCKWFTEDELKSMHSNHYRFYNKSHPEPFSPEPYFNPNFLKPEKIIASKKRDDETFYLVKWTDLGYEDSTWEDGEECNTEYPELIEKFNKSRLLPDFDQLYIPPHPSPQSFRPITHHPSSKSGFHIRQYQLSGLNFLVNAWYNKRNAILADEMGLGKTAQAIMFLDYLEKKQEIRGPFLIVAPLSTIPHWTREIKEWSDLSSITYCGDSIRRKYLKMYEMFYPNTTIPMFQVLLTTYEYVIKADKLLSPIKWRAIIVDEAQRMKNHQSKLFNSFFSYSGDFKLLLTGTPLQNNIEELWTLLHFLDPNAFDNLHKFQENFGDLNEVENIEELQTILKPMMLRRMKSDVEKSIAPLEEIIIECPMTPYQRAYYKSIYDKNIEYLNRGAHKGNMTSLNNIVMELRKVCNHPFLIKGAENQITIEKKEALNLKENEEPPSNFEFDLLVRTAGKMILLDKLLHKLKQDGHRVLIFSQMTKMLDIIQDYLDLADYKFCRIDGSIKSEERQKNIDNFNKKGSNYFVFLLCTRSGGVGINLASADTVIIFDSDYNPQNDIQATSRCHRIGQKKEVKMYRFITAKSYERKMFDMASIKLGLDHAVLGGSKKDELSKFDIEKLLRFGAYYAYEEEEADNKSAETFGEEDIESVISRSTRIQHASVVGGEGSTFSKAHFEISENETDVDLTAPDFWQKYTPVVQEDEDLDSCSIAERHKKLRERLSLEDFNEKMKSSSSAPSLSKITEIKSPKSKSKKKDKEESGPKSLWSLNKISKFMNSLLRFGWGRWNAIIEASNLSFELRQIIAAAHVLLQWLVESSTDGSPIMQSINQKCIENDAQDQEMLDMQKEFIVKHKTAFYQTIISGSNWKLGRLELLYFIDTLVKSAENPPDDLPIPSCASMKPTDWWTLKDDQLLIYNTWKYGFSNYSNEEFKFSQNIAENTKRLTSRLHALMHNLKTTYVNFKTKSKDNKDLPFSCDVLKRALDTWLPKDHKSCVDALILIGEHPDIEKFKEIATLQTKSNESVQEYVKIIIDYCKALKNNESTDSFEIAEPISLSKATKLLNRINFFNDIRTNKVELKSENDNKLIDYICENGFSNMSTELEWTKEAYELTDLSGYNLMKLVRQIRRKTRNRESKEVIRTRIRSTRSNSTVDDFNPNYKVYIEAPFLTKNEDGSYKYPIQVTQKIKVISIGEVVYDRPYYHTDKYIYPVGYQIEKEFYSIEDPNNQAIYRASILDGGNHPLFRVECLDKSKKVFEGNSPSKPWMEASMAIEASKKKFGLPTKDVVTISGPVAYGLPLPIITYLIDHLPNARKCENHIFKKYVIQGEPEPEDEDEDDNNNEERKEKVIHMNHFNHSSRRKNTFKNKIANHDEIEEEEEEELDEMEFDYDDNDESENDSNISDEIKEYDDEDNDNDDSDNNGYSEEDYYEDQSYDDDYQKIKIKMRRIRISRKKRDYMPGLNIKFTHLDEFENELNQNENDINVSFHSDQLVKNDPSDFRFNPTLKDGNSEEKLKEAILKLSEKIDQ